MKSRSRECNNPPRANGGDDCDGVDEEEMACSGLPPCGDDVTPGAAKRRASSGNLRTYLSTKPH
jgi:hypothetical protein